ncbi:MAG: ABC transporter ATP-binding protein [Pseudomonadales bacterium]|nr:ABC transporter ATP-binding protein [Pseudomonadales bacterium]
MIKTNNVSKVVETSEGRLVILEGITLEINQGESVAVVGASGSGKTTLLSLLAGLDSPSDGKIVLGGEQDITVMNEAQRAKLRGEMVGFVFQTFQLLSSLSALENVMLPGELRGDPQAEHNAKKLLDRVGLGHRLQHYPRQLSGGEQQRVAIARAFASNPKILFADEPTGNLDAKTGAKIIDLLFELNADFGTTLVLVTHDARLAARCERSILIDAGLLVSEAVDVSAAIA